MSNQQSPSLLDRLLTAFLAPVAFNFSVLIVMSILFSNKGHISFGMWESGIYRNLDIAFFALLVIPSIGGFLLGSSRFIHLFAHLFYTHNEVERDLRLTALLWVLLIGISYCFSVMLSKYQAIQG